MILLMNETLKNLGSWYISKFKSLFKTIALDVKLLLHLKVFTSIITIEKHMVGKSTLLEKLFVCLFSI